MKYYDIIGRRADLELTVLWKERGEERIEEGKIEIRESWRGCLWLLIVFVGE